MLYVLIVIRIPIYVKIPAKWCYNFCFKQLHFVSFAAIEEKAYRRAHTILYVCALFTIADALYSFPWVQFYHLEQCPFRLRPLEPVL